MKQVKFAHLALSNNHPLSQQYFRIWLEKQRDFFNDINVIIAKHHNYVITKYSYYSWFFELQEYIICILETL